MKIRGSWSFLALTLGTIALSFAVFSESALSQTAPTKVESAFQELFDYSQKEKKGLTFFVQGQTIPGVVTKLVGDDAIEVRNQTSSRIIIRLDRIDAVAAN
jgi:endonuclease YncB( thermonuclease family)